MKRCYFLLFLTIIRLFIFIYISHFSEPIYHKIDFESNNFVFKVISEPKYYWHKQELEVKIINENSVFCDYNILVYLETYPKYDLFDELKVSGKLSEIENNSDFNYKKYLNDKNIFALCFYPRILEVDKCKGSNIRFFFWSLKKRIFSNINKNLPEPTNGLVKAIVLGSKSQLLPELKDRLEKQGLAHVLTVSGLHLGILIYFLKYCLEKIRLKKVFINFILSIFLFFYLFIISFPISALRSALMLVFVFFSKKGIKKRFFNVFCLMLIFSPKLLFNISFQLSFLAVFSIIYFLPILNNNLAKIFIVVGKGRFFYKSKIISILNLSLAVNMVLWPLVVYYFSYYNYLSFLYNLFIVPVLPFFLTLSFFAIILPIFKVVPFYLLYVIGNYINLFSYLNIGYFEIKLNKEFLFIYYSIIFLVVFRNSVFFQKKKILKFIEKAKKEC